MICCKIITDFSNTSASFGKLLNSLARIGESLWIDNCLFFADVDGNTDEKKVASAVRKAGYTKVYVDEYTKDNPPKESDYVNGWLTDKIVKIIYKQCEDKSQEIFRNTMKGLDMINVEIERLSKIKAKKAQKAKNKKED